MFSIIPYRTNRNMVQRPARGFFEDFDNDFFRSFFENGFGGMLRADRSMKVDVRDEGDRFVLEADLPGVAKDNLKVEVNDGVLTIAAEYTQEKDEKDEENRYVYRERRSGSMSRAFNVEGIREDEIRAEFRDGVLKLELPKKEAPALPEARTIEIQ